MTAGGNKPDEGGRRLWLQWGVSAGLLGLAAPVWADSAAAGHGGSQSPDFASPVSLPGALAAALARQQPLLLLASLDGCPFCHVARAHYLWPLARAGAAVLQINFGDSRPVRDWQSKATTQAALVRALGIEMAPTVLFYGPGGREVAQRLEGSSPDFYGAYLDDRLAQARAAVHAGA